MHGHIGRQASLYRSLWTTGAVRPRPFCARSLGCEKQGLVILCLLSILRTLAHSAANVEPLNSQRKAYGDVDVFFRHVVAG